MNVSEEQDMMTKLDKRIRNYIDVTYENIFQCEEAVTELIRLAPCVFDKKTFYDLLRDYRTLDIQTGNFEQIVSQLPDPIDIASALLIDSVMKQLDKLFNKLVGYIDKANGHFNADEFDFSKLELIGKLKNKYEFDSVVYEELEEALDNIFLVCKMSDVLDNDYNRSYDPLHVLTIKGFKTRTEAYRYALSQGISMQNVFTRY